MASAAHIRKPAVAGLFYPAGPRELRAAVCRLLEQANPPPLPACPHALIAPHAGYTYSGPVAASAYAALEGHAGRICRVALMGPSHHCAFAGIATTGFAAYRTPLGDVPVDQPALAVLNQLPGVAPADPVHAPEHSLEVHLPFLQVVLGPFTLVPLVCGEAAPAAVAAVIDTLWDEGHTLVIASSDLSHYQDYATARSVDAQTAAAIERLDAESLTPGRACGCVPVAGLLHAARRRNLAVHRLDLRNSGDTAGPRHQVVGYGAWALTPLAGAL